MLLLGSRPAGRNTEQHDIFFGIGEAIKDLVPATKAFWPEAKGNLHVDAWREVTQVDGFEVKVILRAEVSHEAAAENRLFFLNLGGYKAGEFDEFHYKMLAVAEDKKAAIRQARQTAFYRHTGIKGAPSHIDEKFGVDVDELYQVKDILSPAQKEHYTLAIQPGGAVPEDELHLGYFKLHKL
ncbi:DUF1543 domain-containing protein [Pontibacter akesuensis]|nr:DUF1543 domain-containing protein [Pontibacter akesuensis]GHA80804.1 hypothetical protein GCM10007389_39060 [Pontibacter akesuensis]